MRVTFFLHFMRWEIVPFSLTLREEFDTMENK